MREITKGIKAMAKLGFALTSNGHEDVARRFIKHDKRGRITDSINYIYIEEKGLQVFANSLKYGSGTKMGEDLLNAIKLNFDELKREYK